MAMIDDEKPGTGTVEGTHAPSSGGDRAAAPRPGGDQVPAAVGDDDLLDGSPDRDDGDLLALAADTVAGPRRARGRPKGSANRRNMDMVGYLAALGHRDPMVTLSMIQTADTGELAAALGANSAKGRIAVMQMQRQAASDMLPYFYAKKPQQLELPDGGPLPMIAIGQVNIGQGEKGGILDLMSLQAVQVEKPNEINGATVREKSDDPHEGE